jgi:hypothetical protein
VDISVDTKPLTRFMDDFERRQVPYALSNTLNDVAALAQYRNRERMGSVFTLRRKKWADDNVKITKFAKKNDLVSTLAIQSPGGGTRSDILGKFERSTQKTPHGGRSIVVPANAKVNKQGIIPQSARPKAFNFRRVGGAKALSHNTTQRIRGGIGRGALEVYEGDKRTVMIRNAQGTGVILQRVGRGKNKAGMRVLFFLTPKVKLKPDLHFVDVARQAATHAPGFFKARFAEAMSTAR